MPIFKRGCVVLLLISASACGGSSTTAPTAPTIAQLAGLWTASATLTQVSGGDCVGALFLSSVGSTSRYTLAVQQSGATLTATSTALSDGSTCQYTGTAGTSTFQLNGTFCSAAIIKSVRCSNGALRDVTLTNLGINGTMSGNTGSGTEADTYNITVAGTSSGVGILLLNSSFTMTR